MSALRIIADTHNILLNREEDSLGMGASSVVLPATYMDTPVAIKVYNKSIPDEDIQRETQIMWQFQGVYHIVQLLGSCTYQGRKSVVMDLAFNSTLNDFLYFVGDNASYELRMRLARDVCNGLNTMHERGVAHEDLKPENILLDFGLRAKLCDLGSARSLEDNDYSLSGTREWRSPEKENLQGPWNRVLSDMFSLGKVLLEIFATSRAPEVVYKCVSSNPNERPQCQDVLQALTLPRPSYTNFHGVLKSELGESERINIAYYWTQFRKDEEESVTESRRLFFTGDYNGLRRAFQAAEDAVATQILWAIATFHSISSLETDERDRILALLKGLNLEDDFFPRQTFSLVKYYIALLILTINKSEGLMRLSRLCNEGNSLAQAELAILSFSSVGKTVAEVEADGASFFPLIWRACKNGYCHFQAVAVLLLLLERRQTTSVSNGEKDLLRVSSEGGSALAQLLLDISNNEIDHRSVMQMGSVELFYILGVLYGELGCEDKSWNYMRAAVTGTIQSCLSSPVLELIISHFGSLREQGRVLLEALQIKREVSMGVDASSKYFLRFVVTETEYVNCGIILTYAALGKQEKAMCVARQAECTAALMATLVKLAVWDGIDVAAACEWYSIALSKRGKASADAMLVAARLLEHEGKEELACEWFLASATAGSPEACAAMANFERFRRPPDYEAAKRWYLEAIEGGLASAYYGMAMTLQHQLSSNVDEAVFSYLAQGRQKGCPLCSHHIGLLKEAVDDLDAAFEFFKDCLDMGYETACLDMLRVSKLRGSPDYQYWVRRALRFVNPSLLLLHGMSYDSIDIQCLVDGIAADNSKSSNTIFNLGRFLEWATEFATDSVNCSSCYMDATEQGHDKAPTFMARYLQRIGLNAQAKEWYKKALCGKRHLISEESTQELIDTL